MKNLSDFAVIFNGKTPPRSEQRETGFPVLKIKDVDEHGLFRGQFQSFVDSAFAHDFKEKFIKQGDTLILNAAHNADYVGSKVYRAEGSVAGTLPTGEWLIIRPKENLDPSVAYHWVTAPKTRKQIRELVKGIHLYPKDVARLPVAFPRLEEQRRIAEVLDRADALRKKRRLAIQKLDTLLQSVFLDMFGDPKANPKGWDIRPTGDTLSTDRTGIRTGPFGSSLKKAEYKDAGIPVWGINNVLPNRFVGQRPLYISSEKADQLSNYAVKPGDILISRAGTVGRMCVATPSCDRSIIGTNLVRVSLNTGSLSPIFFSTMFTYFGVRLGSLKSSGDEDAYSFLNPATLRTINIPVPPIDLQHQFERVFKSVEELAAKLKRHSGALDDLFLSVQSVMF